MSQTIRKVPTTKRLWRYMSYERFVDLIETESLYFTKPSQFEDKNEGLLSLGWQSVNAYYDNGKKAHHDFVSQFPEIPAPQYVSYEDKLNYYITQREKYGVSCWHSNKIQSLAMWDLYVGKGKDGVAITTTFNRFYEALKNYHNRLAIGQVEYCDLMDHYDLSFHLNDRPKKRVQYHEEDGLTPLDTLFRKDYSYIHEKEVRAVIQLNYDANGKPINRLSVPLNQIIDYVVISPYSKDSFEHEIRNLMEKARLDPRLTYRSRIIDERKKFVFEKDGQYIIRRAPSES